MVCYLHQDQLGSTILTRDKSGKDIKHVHYDAFGQVLSRNAAIDTPNHLYNGKPRDPMTGLVNYGFRDYDPRQGRFTTVDPIRDGTNWYGYVTNDPLNLIDRYGLETEDRSKGGIRPSDTNWRGIGTGLSQIAVGISGIAGGITTVAGTTARAVLLGRDDVGSAMMAWGGVAAVQTGIVQVGWGVETITKAVSGNLEQGRSFFVPIPSIMHTFLEVLE